jgi:hypothetical protein
MVVVNVNKQKLIQDFLETDEITKQITKGQIDIATGVDILKDMIKYVRNDIEILDQETYHTLEEIIKQLGETNHTRKEQIKKSLKEPEDSMDELVLKRHLLKEDLMKYKEELKTIQKLASNKGWFD